MNVYKEERAVADELASGRAGEQRVQSLALQT